MTEKLSFKTKLAYGVAATGDAGSYTILGTFLMFFLTTVAGINPVTAGTIAAIGSIWDATCSPIIGYISDNSKSKYGRRTPFMFFAAFPLGISCSLLFSSIDASYGLKVAYYGILVIAFWTAFSCFFIPYMALGAEITKDYDERTSLRSIAYGFNIVGMVIGMVMPTLIVDFLLSKDTSTAHAWQGAGTMVGVMVAVSILYTCFVLRGKKQEPENSEENVAQIEGKSKIGLKSMVKEYLEVLKLKPILYLIGASISYLVANAMNSSDRMYFMTYNLKFEAGTITFAMLFCILSGILFIPIVINFSKKFDKRTVLIFSLGVGAIGSISANFIGIHTIFGMCAFLLVFTCANSSYWQLMPAMIYDVCEVDELVYGRRREGSVISLQALAEAIASAIGMQILGIILGNAGFDGTVAVQSENSLFWVKNSLTIIPAMFMILSMFMVIKYPITKARFGEVMDALEKRKNGEAVDLETMKFLL